MVSGFDDLLGQGDVLQPLLARARAGRLHHCYLFEGPPAVGKHTAAVRLAMAANCSGSGTVLPCGTCPTCLQMSKGLHPDLIELGPDPDKKTKVISRQQSREVVRLAGLRSYNAAWRTFIIDPVDLLQPEAINALLKTLEEPPAGTHFLLIVTNSASLLPTIVSRCQRVRFGAVQEQAIVDWLRERGADSPEICARLSHGCPGRALALAEGALDRRMAVRDQLLRMVHGSVGDVFDATADLCRGKRQDWMKDVEALIEVAEDMVRDAAILGSRAELPLLNADIPDEVGRWSRALWPTGVSRCEEALADVREDLVLNVTGRTAVDALVNRIRAELRPH